MAYLRLAVTLHDDVALARIVNVPKRALGDASLAKLQAASKARGITLSTLLLGGSGVGEGAAGGGGGGEARVLPPLPSRDELQLTPKAYAAVEEFRQLMAGLHAAVATLPLAAAVERLLKEVGWLGGAGRLLLLLVAQHGRAADRLVPTPSRHPPLASHRRATQRTCRPAAAATWARRARRRKRTTRRSGWSASACWCAGVSAALPALPALPVPVLPCHPASY